MQSLALQSKLAQPLLGLQQRAQEPHSLGQLARANLLMNLLVQQPSALERSFAAKAEFEAHLWILFWFQVERHQEIFSSSHQKHSLHCMMLKQQRMDQ